MATRPKGYGMTRELSDKQDAKYDPVEEAEIVEWIEARTKRCKEDDVGPNGTFREWLLDGYILRQLIKSFGDPSLFYKTHDTRAVKLEAMKKMKNNENIEMFLKAAEKMGMTRQDMFQTVNISENQNMAQVLSTIYSLGAAAQRRKVEGPTLGIKMSDKHEREFSEAKLKAGQNVIGLQMGTNQVASQSGMTGYGQGRQIIHKTK